MNDKRQNNVASCCDSSLMDLLDNRFFKALADSSRLTVLMQLVAVGNHKTVTEIAACCPQSISVISRHLKTLKENGILSSEKQGKEVVYAFRNKEVAQQLRDMADVIENCC